jgi:hypothetical protein
VEAHHRFSWFDNVNWTDAIRGKLVPVIQSSLLMDD